MPRRPAGWPTPMPGSTRSISPWVTSTSPAARHSPPPAAGPAVCRTHLPPAGPLRRTAWDAPTFDTLAAGDRAVADALALARVLRRVAQARAGDRFGTVAAAEATLAPFGAGPLDPVRFAAWRAAFPPVAQTTRRRPGRPGEGDRRDCRRW